MHTGSIKWPSTDSLISVPDQTYSLTLLGTCSGLVTFPLLQSTMATPGLSALGPPGCFSLLWVTPGSSLNHGAGYERRLFAWSVLMQTQSYLFPADCIMLLTEKQNLAWKLPDILEGSVGRSNLWKGKSPAERWLERAWDNHGAGFLSLCYNMSWQKQLRLVILHWTLQGKAFHFSCDSRADFLDEMWKSAWPGN